MLPHPAFSEFRIDSSIILDGFLDGLDHSYSVNPDYVSILEETQV